MTDTQRIDQIADLACELAHKIEDLERQNRTMFRIINKLEKDVARLDSQRPPHLKAMEVR